MARNQPNQYADVPPIGGFDRPPADKADGAADFWAVWCPQEGVFVENIWWYQFQAQQDAEVHNARHDPRHTAFAYHMVFQQSVEAETS